MKHEALGDGLTARGAAGAPGRFLHVAQIPKDAPNPAQALLDEFGETPLALIVLMVSSTADFEAVVQSVAQAFPEETDVVGCTTAGEIGNSGYDENTIVAVAFPAAHFATACLMIDGLSTLDAASVSDDVIRSGVALRNSRPEFSGGFAMLLVDGLSLKEDELVAAVSPALGGFPLFGGSAGDGTTFAETKVALNGQTKSDGAVLTLVRTDLDCEVFSLDHLVPTERQMVVTDAEPDKRLVKEINAEPAAREYARIVGKDPDQLDPFTFAAHPVVVRIGDTHHVRAIQRVTELGELIFFSAIDEGMVLTVAESHDMAEHLDAELDRLSAGTGGAILGFDCILRRIEAEQNQLTRAVSDVLLRHRVVGFSTYGEQIGPLHVNQTMSGVAIRPPPSSGAGK